MKCPECLGAGEIEYEDKFGFPMSSTCADCKGTGEVPDETTAYGTDCRNGTCE